MEVLARSAVQHHPVTDACTLGPIRNEWRDQRRLLKIKTMPGRRPILDRDDMQLMVSNAERHSHLHMQPHQQAQRAGNLIGTFPSEKARRLCHRRRRLALHDGYVANATTQVIPPSVADIT
jgi:hypothetical protein